MKYGKKLLNTHKLTKKDRATLIKFCLSYVDRATISTKNLIGPLTMEDLENAFIEKEQSHIDSIKKYENSLENFETQQFSQNMIDYFEGEIKKDEYAEYVNQVVNQEREIMGSIRKSYNISVSFEFLNDEEKVFHESLNPRITFGYSNCLHEECNFDLNEQNRKVLLNSSLKKTQSSEWLDYGTFFIDENMMLVYEDLSIYKNGNTILETISHEQMFDIFFENNDLELFRDFENKNERNELIIKKLLK